MENLISITEFCNNLQVEASFVSSLRDYGLIEVITIEQSLYIPVKELGKLEKLSRLHYDLDINMEGIETIIHMLDRIDAMQQEIQTLKNRLRVYENE